MNPLFKVFFALLLLLIGTDCLAQCPDNIGFENGSFANWQCYAGTIDMNGVISVSETGPVEDRHTLIDSSNHSVDKYGGFPIACPNGSGYSMRLGNDQTKAQAERVTYTFTVPPGAQYTLLFNYAVVLQNPAHDPIAQPKFTAQIFNATDNTYISCPSFDFIASSDLPGFTLSNYSSETQGAAATAIYYKEWSTASINLVGYAGKSIRLEFTTNDCTMGGHFGYAYIDVAQTCGSPITGNTNCVGQKDVTTLYAPAGFQTYTWYTGDLKTKLYTGPTFKITPVPPNMTKYALIITPYLGLGCIDTLYTTINKIGTAFNLQVVDTVYGCAGVPFDLTSPKITAGSSADLTYSYFTDPVNLIYAYNPRGITASGIYYIRGINPEGCQDILPVQVIITTPVINVSDPPAVVFPATVNLLTTYQPLKRYTYGYYSDATATTPIDKIIAASGTYYIKAETPLGCTLIEPVHVVINPPPPYEIIIPNAFSPNNDGINDFLSVKLEGYVTFGLFTIFNRNGQQLFTAKAEGQNWDGNYNGKQLPAGTYYWIFNGMDAYYHTPITKSGYVAIIR